MKRIAALVAGFLLGLPFFAGGVMILFNLGPTPPAPPEGSAQAHFMAAFATTGYLKFVKGFEVIGGLLVAIPRTRRAGLLVLGPILINIIAYHLFVMGGEGLFSPVILVLVALTLFLTWVERRAFAQFLSGAASAGATATPRDPQP